MSTKSANTGLSQQIHSSKLLTGIVCIAFSIALTSIMLLAKIHPLFLLSLPIVAISFYTTLTKHCLNLSSNAIVSCQQVSKDKWQLINRVGKSFLVKKLEKAYRSPYMVILSFQQLYPMRKMTVVIAYDAVSKDAYTQLLSNLWNQ